jgi:hypothetical protein
VGVEVGVRVLVGVYVFVGVGVMVGVGVGLAGNPWKITEGRHLRSGDDLLVLRGRRPGQIHRRGVFVFGIVQR